MAASYVTIEEDAKLKPKQEKKMRAEKKKEKSRVAVAMAMAAMAAKTQEEGTSKIPKHLSHIECFRCKEKGHYSTSKECPLHPSHKKQDTTAFANSSWEEYEAGIYTTFCVECIVYMMQGLLPTEVLLDNQANTSIVNPRNLKNVRAVKHKIRVNGVGGTQLIVNKVGVFDGLQCP